MPLARSVPYMQVAIVPRAAGHGLGQETWAPYPKHACSPNVNWAVAVKRTKGGDAVYKGRYSDALKKLMNALKKACDSTKTRTCAAISWSFGQ